MLVSGLFTLGITGITGGVLQCLHSGAKNWGRRAHAGCVVWWITHVAGDNLRVGQKGVNAKCTDGTRMRTRHMLVLRTQLLPKTVAQKLL